MFFPADTMGKRRRHELTDAQWAKIERLLPGKGPGRTASDNRLFESACVFVCRTGVPWADPPARFGRPDAVRKRYDRWCAKGVWRKAAAATGEADLAEVRLDATTVKAHPVASTGRRLPREKSGRRRTPLPGPLRWRSPGHKGD